MSQAKHTGRACKRTEQREREGGRETKGGREREGEIERARGREGESRSVPRRMRSLDFVAR
jgi:hypothetical protein